MPEPTNQEQQSQGQQSESFDSFIAAQPAEVKALYEAHTGGLKSALESERTARKDLEKQLRDLAKKAEAGSEAQKTLTEQADKLSSLERQTAFYAAAHSAGVRNLSLAHIAAQQAGLIDEKGNCDFGKLKAAYPELFLVAPPANGGNGTGAGQQVFSMNEAIRRATGRQ